MMEAVVVSAVRTAVGTAFKGTLTETPPETLAVHVLTESLKRAGVAPDDVDDVMFAESLQGGGDIARYAAVQAGMIGAPGQAVNRHCAGSLTTVGNASAAIMAGMADAVVAGGVQSSSLAPQLTTRVPGTIDAKRQGNPPTYPYRDDTGDDVTLTVGWNVAQHLGLTREQMDRWALRSHQRAIAAIDAGAFVDEIAPITVTTRSGDKVDFRTDEHPRRNTSLEKLSSLQPLHPEIEGFSITAGNASGINDAAAALTLVSRGYCEEKGLEPLAVVKGWAAVGVDPTLMGLGGIEAAKRVMDRAKLAVADFDLWEINEAFASVPVAACQELGIDEEKVNVYGSGCSLGHPVAASGARMLTTLVHQLRARGGGLGIATMCAGGGQGGAVVLEVF